MVHQNKRVKKKVTRDDKSPYLAAVLIRSIVATSPDQRKTLQLLRLHRQHVCVVVKNNKINRGMLQKVKDLVAYGEIDDAMFKTLQEKRGQKTKDDKGAETLKPFFRLHPPKGGFERKGIKKDYISGGALGYRGIEMKSLLQKMI